MYIRSYGLWCVVSLCLHVLVLVLIKFVPLATPPAQASESIPVTVVQVPDEIAATPTHGAAIPKIALPKAEAPAISASVAPTKVPHPIATSPRATRHVVTGPLAKLIGSALPPTPSVSKSHKPGVQPGPGDASKAPGTSPGGNNAPPIMTSETGTHTAPSGTSGGDGATGPQGASASPGPTYGAAAQGGPRAGASKAAGEVDRSDTVVLLVKVNSDGSIDNIEIVQRANTDILTREAERLVRRWIFKPAMEKGTAVADTVRMKVTFSSDRYTIEEVR